ncbi:MAG: DUF499 domain-containing protein [Bacteroidetes bacterium]|nr:DUF499 domain-containing protein [Bacteroidota bacterium]
MENIKEPDLLDMEFDLLKGSILGGKLKTYIWEDKPLNISDSEELKLVILKKEDKTLINDILKLKGQTPRVYRNTIFLLYPLDAERTGFLNTLKRKIAFENISKDQHLKLTNDQKKEVKDELKKLESPLKESVRRLYRMVAIPDKDGFKEKDLGIPTYGLIKGLDEELFEQLRLDGEILEKIAPIVLKEKYLIDKEYVSTEKLFQSTLKTPGEARPSNRNVLESGIIEGIQMGLFGLGELENENPKCIYFKGHATVSFTSREILIKDTICEEQKKEKEEIPEGEKVYGEESKQPASIVDDEGGKDEAKPIGKVSNQLSLKFKVPKGKVSGIMGVMNLLQSKFNTLEISLSAKDGSISQQEIDDKIAETFRQLNIDFDLD